MTFILLALILIVSEVPMASGSHTNDFLSSSDMALLSDPHFLYAPLCGPTVIVKFRRKCPVTKKICHSEVLRYNANNIPVE